MRSFSILFVLGLFGACSPYDPDLGAAPFLCGDAEPRCPDGYTCQPQSSGMEVCLAPNGTLPDSGGGNSGCADDSTLEPNDSIQMAFQTPVATQKNNLMFAGLAICPAGDKDNYAITITMANQNLEMIIEYATTGADLQGAILNSNGSPIGNATPMSAGVRRAYTPNLPVGTYYAQVYGPNSGAVQTNNYKLTVNVTGP
jgi:hypothetical protein